MPKLNKEQQSFVDAIDKNVLVSASAGSGKTTTMIEKIIDMVIGKNVSIDDMMVVTFTVAAANDMKQKLASRINDRLMNADDELHGRLSNELEKINIADIGTLHSICKKYITKYFYAIQVDPDFSVASQEESKNLFNQAMVNVLDRISENDESKYYPLLEFFYQRRRVNEIQEAIREVYHFLSSLADDAHWIENAIKNPTIDYFDYIHQHVKRDFSSLQRQITKELTIIKEKSINILRTELESIHSFLSDFTAERKFAEALNVLFDFKFPNKPRVNKNMSEEEKDYLEITSDFFYILKGRVENARKICITNDYESLTKGVEMSRHILLLLIDVVSEVKKEYTTLKKDRNLLDFNDLEDNMKLLLQDKSVLKEISLSKKFIFVDEYQDINEKQDKIIASIRDGDNLFLIGDVKQSIYEFRQASPEIFLDKYNRYPRSEKGKVLQLNKNYRSDPVILSFANKIFNEIITVDTVGIDYRKTSQLETENGSFATAYPKVKVSIIDTPKSGEDKVDKEQSHVTEANAILSEISQLIGKKYYNYKVSEEKIIDYKDIIILVRSRGDNVETLYNKLKNNGIPVTANIKTDLFNTYEGNVLMSFLHVLNNHLDDYNLTTLLLSPLGSFCEQELANIKVEDNRSYIKKRGEKNYFFTVLERCKNDKVKKFFDTIDRYRKLLITLPVEDVLRTMVKDCNLKTLWGSSVNGIAKVNNLAKFIELLDGCSDKYDIVSVLNMLEIYRGEGKINVEIGESNSVKIMTIHDSKGLEAPVVFLAGMGKQFNNNTRIKNVVISKEIGIGIKSLDIKNKVGQNSLLREACILSKRKSEMDEEIRLLYVAITRAQNILRIVGGYNTAVFKKSKYIYSCNNHLELILQSFTQRESNAVLNKNSSTLLSDSQLLEILQVSKDSDDEKTPLIISSGDSSLVDTLRNNIGYKYPFTSTIAVKNSVTSLLQSEDYTQESFTPKSFDIYHESNVEYSPQEKGVAYHAVMEQLTYHESRKDVENIINSLREQNKIGKNIVVDVDEILSAIEHIRPIIGGKKIIKEAQFMMSDVYKNLMPVSGGEEKIIVQGIVDLIIFDGNTAKIVDFKTNKYRSKQQFIDAYSLQLELYAKAVEWGYNVTVTDKFIYSFHNKKVYSI